MNLFDRVCETRKTERHGKVIGHAGFRTDGYRKRKSQISLPNEPNTFGPILRRAEPFETGDVPEIWLRRNFGHTFALERSHKTIVRDDNFREARGDLLKFALKADVGIISVPISKQIKSVAVVNVSAADPTPREVVKACDVGDRCWSKFRILTEKCRDLERIKITDESLTSAPVIAITLVGNQVPP